jgi:hypothetical protein
MERLRKNDAKYSEFFALPLENAIEILDDARA